MDQFRRADGFQLFSGTLAVISGPVILAAHGPAGWAVLLMASGLVLLATQWTIVQDVHWPVLDRAVVFLLVVGAIAVGVAFVYLTRAADDLPRLSPGHDGDSERFRLLPGVVALVVGTGVLASTIVAATRHHHEP